MNNMNIREMVSALADGQLVGQELEEALAVLANDPEALQAWESYHLIGDVLRSSDLASARAATQFAERVSQRLAAQAPDQAPVAATPLLAQSAQSAVAEARPAANDSVFRWKVAAGFASVAAALSVGWALLGSGVLEPETPQLATAPAGAGFVMIRNPQLDELLEAHQQLGGSGALQMPAGFVRQVTVDGPTR